MDGIGLGTDKASSVVRLELEKSVGWCGKVINHLFPLPSHLTDKVKKKGYRARVGTIEI